MAFTRILGASTSIVTTSSNIAVTSTTAILSGALVAGVAAWDNTGSPTVLSVVDDKGNTYNLGTKISDVANSEDSQAFWLGNITNGPITFTVHLSASVVARTIIIDEFTGALASSNPSDGFSGKLQTTNSSATDNITSSSITTTTDGDLIYGAMIDTAALDAALPAVGTGFASGTSQTAHVVGITEFLTQTSHGTVSATYTSSVNHSRIISAVAFKPAAGTTPTGFYSQSLDPYPAQRPFTHLAPSAFTPPVQPDPTLTWQSRISAEIPKRPIAYLYTAPNPAFVSIPPQVLGWGSVFADAAPARSPGRESPFIAWTPQTIAAALVTGWNPSFPDFVRGKPPSPEGQSVLGQPPIVAEGWSASFAYVVSILPQFNNSQFLAWAPQTITTTVVTTGWNPTFPDFASGRKVNTDSPSFAFGQPPFQVLGWNPSFPDFAKGRAPNTDSPAAIIGRPPFQVLGWNPAFPDSARGRIPLTHSPSLAWAPQTIVQVVITGWNPSYPDFAKGYRPRTDSPFTALGRPPAQVLGWNPTFPDFAKAKQPPTHSPFLAWTTLGTIPVSYWHPVLSIPVRTKEGLRAGAHQFLAWSDFTPAITTTITLTTSDLFDQFLAQLDTSSQARFFASVGIVEKTQHSGSVGVLATRPIVSAGAPAGAAIRAKVAIRET